MNISTKSFVLVGAVAGILSIGGVAYATTSIDFSTRAQSWATATCTQELIKSKNTLSNNQKATICYNFLKANEQQLALNNQQLSIDELYARAGIPGPKGDKGDTGEQGPQGLPGVNAETATLYDGNNNVLGPLVTPVNLSIYGSIAFYSDELKLIVPIDNQGVIARGEYLIGWSGPNCTGTPYLSNGHSGNTLTILDTMTLVQINGRYYAPTSNFSDRSLQSEENYAGQCNAKIRNSYVSDIELIGSLPYSQPLTMPITFGE